MPLDTVCVGQYALRFEERELSSSVGWSTNGRRISGSPFLGHKCGGFLVFTHTLDLSHTFSPLSNIAQTLTLTLTLGPKAKVLLNTPRFQKGGRCVKHFFSCGTAAGLAYSPHPWLLEIPQAWEFHPPLVLVQLSRGVGWEWTAHPTFQVLLPKWSLQSVILGASVFFDFPLSKHHTSLKNGFPQVQQVQHLCWQKVENIKHTCLLKDQITRHEHVYTSILSMACFYAFWKILILVLI